MIITAANEFRLEIGTLKAARKTAIQDRQMKRQTLQKDVKNYLSNMGHQKETQVLSGKVGIGLRERRVPIRKQINQLQ